MSDVWYSLSWAHMLIVLTVIITLGIGWLVWEYLHAPLVDDNDTEG